MDSFQYAVRVKNEDNKFQYPIALIYNSDAFYSNKNSTHKTIKCKYNKNYTQNQNNFKYTSNLESFYLSLFLTKKLSKH